MVNVVRYSYTITINFRPFYVKRSLVFNQFHSPRSSVAPDRWKHFKVERSHHLKGISYITKGHLNSGLEEKFYLYGVTFVSTPQLHNWVHVRFALMHLPRRHLDTFFTVQNGIHVQPPSSFHPHAYTVAGLCRIGLFHNRPAWPLIFLALPEKNTQFEYYRVSQKTRKLLKSPITI